MLGSQHVREASTPIPAPRDRGVAEHDSLAQLLGHGSWPQPCQTLGVSVCTCGASRLVKTKPTPFLCHGTLLPTPAPKCTPPCPPAPSCILEFCSLRICKCLVVTMTYCLGQCSFPMHTNILWLLYMNIFNDMEKVVDFLFFF